MRRTDEESYPTPTFIFLWGSIEAGPRERMVDQFFRDDPRSWQIFGLRKNDKISRPCFVTSSREESFSKKVTLFRANQIPHIWRSGRDFIWSFWWFEDQVLQASSIERPTQLNLRLDKICECCQTWVVKVQVRKTWLIFSSPSLHREQQPGPAKDLFLSLSYVRIIFSRVHHMNIISFWGNFNFQIPGFHHFGSSWKCFEEICWYPAFWLYCPCLAWFQTNSSCEFESHMWEESKAVIYLFQSSDQMFGISRAWLPIHPWC